MPRAAQTYRRVGSVVGRLYDADGDPTPLLILAETQAERHAAAVAATATAAAAAGGADAAEEEQHPCNVSWTRAMGGTVYCSEGRRPRRVLVRAGEGQGMEERCACLVGDAESSARRLYEGCAPDRETCQTSPPEEPVV